MAAVAVAAHASPWVAKQTENAQKIAAWLDSKEGGRSLGVSVVHHPSLPSRADHEIAKRQMPGGFGGVLSIELETEESAKALPSALSFFCDATSLGGVESLIEWRRKYDDGVPSGLLRLSIGVEDSEDLIADLEQGLNAVMGKRS
eukprot:CAMPEP_0170199628 /NCGR_PEP_ID=MMETSP0040_2-20121228/69442_1 /TAXON_ID=641309 /ORGANISM="Lotharella oceanica, Strain CCMP622" /LENGTH=144 /DNA_ID=CAMNT_0010449767 /DNA_START=141 /DNA_END=576 /DNA_ORIENTATION=+